MLLEKTHCQKVFPFTRADVSSLAMTALARTMSAILSASAASGIAPRASILAMAPSEIFKPNTPRTNSVRRA